MVIAPWGSELGRKEGVSEQYALCHVQARAGCRLIDRSERRVRKLKDRRIKGACASLPLV